MKNPKGNAVYSTTPLDHRQFNILDQTFEVPESYTFGIKVTITVVIEAHLNIILEQGMCEFVPHENCRNKDPESVTTKDDIPKVASSQGEKVTENPNPNSGDSFLEIADGKACKSHLIRYAMKVVELQ
jgi:hypothetical protein